MREHIDPRHEIMVYDMHNNDATERLEAFGIRPVAAIVVAGALLACCKNTSPTLRESTQPASPSPGA